MSSGRGSGAGNGAGVQPIPVGARKVVQSLKEIVNCPDAEIYAALKECNMDPNEAVNRLLTQDPFHEVKRKREKKKEGKDISGPRSRSASNNLNRGSKGGSDRSVTRSLSPYNVSDSPLHGKSAHKKENGTSSPYASYLSSASGSENNRGWGPSVLSDAISAENKGSLMGTAEGLPSGAQPTSGYQSAWVGAPGQVSMADIVRMGRTHHKPSNTSNASHYIIQNPSTTESLQDKISTDDTPQIHQSEASSVQKIPTSDEWPSEESPVNTNAISAPEYSDDPELNPGASGMPFDSANLHSRTEGVQVLEDDEIGISGGKNGGSVSISTSKIQGEDSRGASLLGNDLYESRGSYHSEANDFEHQEDEEVDTSASSVTKNFQQLSVDKDENGFPSEGIAPSVVIPDHLQVQAADCPHLNFGSFRSASISAYSSGPMASESTKDNLDLVHEEDDIQSVEHTDNRHSDYYVDESLRNDPDSGLFHRTGANAGSYDAPSASQPEELKSESAEVVHGNQYSFPSNPGFAFDDKQNLTPPFNQTGSQTPDFGEFSSVTHHHTNSLPSILMTVNPPPNRESDLNYSAFPMTQSLPAKYGNTGSSIGASAISMTEALRNAGLPSTQPALQTLSGTNVATGPPLPQQLALHPYSQTALPLGPYASMMGYPFLPQSYAYLPSAFPQSLAGNSTYHQSLASVLPQYKSSVSVSSLPQSAAVASGYGAFGSNATLPGNYSALPSAAPSGTALSYDDVLSSQYKDSAHLLAQQNENLAAWLHGSNPRTMQAAQYNYPGHNQQMVGLRQGQHQQQQQQQQQQQSQNYGTPGYPNFYQSGISLDQQQNPRDASLSNSQGPPKQSQMWPNGY